MSVPLFVYGTLKRPGVRRRHRLLRDARYVDSASISGHLYDLGRYPGVFRDSVRTRVLGELYEIPETAAPRALRLLDEYEGSEFARRRVMATLRDGSRRIVWAYLLRKRPANAATLGPVWQRGKREERTGKREDGREKREGRTGRRRLPKDRVA
jgi:gamma-glutamylcyclotransferase (GGCT)/AIG2-like uncharacterized protein YtfP